MGISLLIVEDDVEASGVIRTLLALKLPGVEIRVAENGRSGLENCRKHRPGIVITDINMPDMDGVQMVREIREIKPDTKFIVVTGYSSKSRDFGDVEIHDYFVKPTDFRKLLAAIEACIEEIKVMSSAPTVLTEPVKKEARH